MELVLVRHGLCTPESPKRFIGSSDLPLTATGRRQASALAPLIKHKQPQRCFCSPLLRCQETAARCTGGLTLPVNLDPDLREINFGEWEGLTFDEIAARDPGAVALWAKLDPGFGFPGGDLLPAFEARVACALSRVLNSPDERVLMVTHGGVIRMAICRLLGLEASHYLLFDVRPGTAATLRVFEGKAVLTGLNEAAFPGGGSAFNGN